MIDNELISLDDISGEILAISVIYSELYDNYISTGSYEGAYINSMMVDNLQEISKQIEKINIRQISKQKIDNE